MKLPILCPEILNSGTVSNFNKIIFILDLFNLNI